MKPSPAAWTLLASPASSAFGDCIEKESGDRIVGKLDVARVMVMYGGLVAESGPTNSVFERLAHPYTRGLFGARPRLGTARGAKLATIPGRVPELVDLPRGCPFADRCHRVLDVCREPPPAFPVLPEHEARCFNMEPPP